jgi:hypothetical protein
LLRSRVIPFSALAFLAAVSAPLRAQAAPRIELAFGYECGDRFIVKNDGAQPVLVEYAPAGSRDKSQLHLNGKQSVEIAMAQDGNLDLFVGGKLVASAPKGNRPCGGGSAPASASAPASDTSVVRPPDHPPERPQAPDSTTQGDSSTTVPPVFVYAPPTDIVLVLPHPYRSFYVYYPHPSVGPSGSGGYSRAVTRRQQRP